MSELAEPYAMSLAAASKHIRVLEHACLIRREVFAALLATPKLGVATTAALIIAGQLAAALAVDQFGWFDMPQHPVTIARAAGALCLLAGVLLIRN